MNNLKDYFDVARQYLDIVERECEADIIAAGKMFAECFDNDGLVQLFGVKHGLEFSMELGYRAGGLMPFHQCKLGDLALRGVLDEKEIEDPMIWDRPETAQQLLSLYNIHPADMFLICSFGGYEAAAVETALIARRQGRKVIAVLSRAEAAQHESTHPSARKLDEVADLVIDTHSPYPDVSVKVGKVKMCQLSTFCANIIAQMITAETYRYITEQGKECPVLLSANVKGADVHNREISDKYVGRWNSI